MSTIAVPVVGERFSEHFGAADGFLIFETTDGGAEGLAERRVQAPPHEQGVFPAWLCSLPVGAVLAGGMGPRAQQMFQAYSIDVVLGIPGGTPRALVGARLRGELASQGSGCEGRHLTPYVKSTRLDHQA